MAEFDRKDWKPAPNPLTPVNADGLNDFEDRVEAALAKSLGSGVFNVRAIKRFGLTNLVPDNTGAMTGTNNSAALQDLVDYIADTFPFELGTAATIYFPPGKYGFNGEVVIPIGVARYIRIVGAGRGGTNVQTQTKLQVITRLRRIGGTQPIIRVASPTSATDFCSVEIRELAMDGGKDFGIIHADPLLSCAGAPEVRLRDVKFTGNDGAAMVANGVNNGDMSGVRVHNCGSAWLHPSFSGLNGLYPDLVDRTPAFVISGGDPWIGKTNTLRMTDCEFEANLGPDFVIWDANKVTGENFKFEGYGDGGAYGYLLLLEDTECQLSNIGIASHRPKAAIAKTGPNEASAGNDEVAVTKLQVHIHQQVGVAPHFIDQRGGGLILRGSFSQQPGSEPSAAYWKLGTDVYDEGQVLADGLSWDSDIPLFNDLRD